MLYLTSATITSVDLVHYGVSRAKDWVSVDRGTREFTDIFFFKIIDLENVDLVPYSSRSYNDVLRKTVLNV